ncbi:MAG: DUF4270 family protein [Bacteroidales bacterium]|nr:DUF4270 family protein [Bacteroidales bacterium]
MVSNKWPYSLLMVLLTLFWRCSKDENEFVLGIDFIESQTGIVEIDTFQMQMSTVKLDSMPTNETGLAICGIIDDDYFGKVTCQPYFQFGIPYDEPSLDAEDVFDSIVLVMPYTGSSYGDTNLVLSYSVHLLEDDMEPVNSSYFFNTSSIPYNEEPLAEVTFTPYPNYMDSLTITLDTVFGRELFDLIMEGSEILESDEDFIEYLKGMTVIPNSNTPGVVIAHNSYSEYFMLRLFYHTPSDDEEIISEYIDFPVLYDLQFNSIKGERSNTLLKNLISQRNAIPSSQTDDLTFIQGGTGIMTCVRFPSLNNFQLMERQTIVKAQIILMPLESSYFTVDLPDAVNIVSTNKYNHYLDVYTDYYGEEVTAALNLDDAYHENTNYTFDITSYVLNEFSDGYFDANNGLLISFPGDGILSRIERIIFNAKPGKSRLIIYSLYY